jgi:hypothetical protein
VVRLEAGVADGVGGASTSVDIGLAGGAQSDDTRYNQVYMRDPGPGSPCGGGFNLSNGIRIDWLP